MKKYFNIILIALFYVFIIADTAVFTIWQGYISDRYIMFQDYLKPFIFITLLWIIFFILIKLLFFKISRVILVLILLLTILTAGLYRYLHKLHIHFNEYSIKAILQTNFSESVSFLNSFILDTKSILSFGILFIVGIFLAEIYIHNKKKNIVKSKKTFTWLILFTILICGTCVLFTEIRPIKLFFQTYTNYYKNLKEFSEIILKENNNIVAKKKGEDTGELYVLVIGESQNKDFMHIFNNTLSFTTPMLDKQSEHNLLLLNNAYASITHTVEALSLALINNTIEKKANSKNLVTLQTVAKKAGFETYWISNQAKIGQYSTPISVLASSSNHQIFLNETESIPSYPDEIIFPQLDKILKSLNRKKNNFIIIHLMGNHSEYGDRYTEKFQIQQLNYPSQGLYGTQFGEKKGANRIFSKYINSIIYNDFVMGTLISKLNQEDSFNGLFYFADHGEDPLIGHDFNKHTPLMLRIPAYFYLSDKFIRTYPHTYQNLIKNKDSIFINDSVFDNMIDLLQIDCIYNNKEKSLANNNFKNLTIDEAIIVDNIKLITDPYYNLEDRANNKIYLHRTDSLYKAKFASNFKIDKYEIDLIYDKDNGLIINHDEFHNGDLTLKEFLTQHNKFTKKIWLDIKNLTSTNNSEILKELEILDKYFNIKGKSLIESQYPDALPKLINQRWACSYYLPWSDLLNEEKREQTTQNIKNNINKYNINGISFDFVANDKIKEIFKEEIKNKHLKMYAWDLENNLGNHNLKDTLSKYDNLEIVLLPLNTPFDY